MLHQQKGVAKKHERHYRESRLTAAVALIALGVLLILLLAIVWPQYLFPRIFNSRLLFELTIDKDDYATCSSEYALFVDRADAIDTSLLSFYLFNVTNTGVVIERGVRPSLVQMGPYSFRKHSFKYDLSVDENTSSSVAYKEYSRLTPVPADSHACTRSYLGATVACTEEEGFCECKNPEQPVTVVNPSFSKLLHKEGGTSLISYFSLELFQRIKRLFETEFTSALKDAIVPRALEEIALFRTLALRTQLMRSSFDTLVAAGFSGASVLRNDSLPPCGLADTCPWNRLATHIAVAGNNTLAKYNVSITLSDMPALDALFDRGSELSLLVEEGVAKWIGACLFLGLIGTPLIPNGVFASLTDDETRLIYEALVDSLLLIAHPTGLYSAAQAVGARAAVDGVCAFLRQEWFDKFKSAAFDLLAHEYANTTYLVVCGPSGARCRWQWGGGAAASVALLTTLLSVDLKEESNLNSLFLEKNAARRFNTNTHCLQLLSSTPASACDYRDYVARDGGLLEPAVLWLHANTLDVLDEVELLSRFAAQPLDTQAFFADLACSLAQSMFVAYPSTTSFNDDYLISYVNLYKEPALTHTFTVENMQELGWAQFGCGGITKAVHQVRSITQLRRNAMWDFSDADYVSAMAEYSTWATTQGFPQAALYDVFEARDMLTTLACGDANCRELKKSLSDTSFTFVGDGTTFVNGVGRAGETAFILENNQATFTCSHPFESICTILNRNYVSSFDQCKNVELLYLDCTFQVFLKNYWATACDLFQTTITNPSTGIACDENAVLTHKHPYRKLLGNIMNRMMTSLTVKLVMQTGLVCFSQTACAFNTGGAFITTTVNKLLFDGMSDPLVIRYLNLRYLKETVSFSCLGNPLSACGKANYACDKRGIRLTWRTGHLDLNVDTDKALYFASEFYFDSNGELLDFTARNFAAFSVMNPIFALYPAWTSNDTEFLKSYQCEGRVFYGPDSLFQSCLTTVDSGSVISDNVGKLVAFKGNSSIGSQGGNLSVAVRGSIDVHEQQTPLLWDGFAKYPYLYQFKSEGVPAHTKPPVLFDQYAPLPYEYTQSEILARFRTIKLSLYEMYNDSSASKSLPVRRFTEDSSTWNKIRDSMGKQRDAYGMPYTTPIGMASMEHLANFPLFVGTPQNYGNQKWGGVEYEQVSGFDTSNTAALYRSFADMDPITGRALRKLTRKQLLIRLERGPLLENLVSSEGRCVAPTKAYARGSGYGCSLYAPLLWSEDARVIPKHEYIEAHEKFYSTPNRASLVMNIGAILGSGILFIGIVIYVYEDYHRRRFYKRVYID